MVRKTKEEYNKTYYEKKKDQFLTKVTCEKCARTMSAHYYKYSHAKRSKCGRQIDNENV